VKYQIESRSTKDPQSDWTAEIGAISNSFDTPEQAFSMIEDLKWLGPDWSDAEYRVGVISESARDNVTKQSA
jgi:hypothetical protein